MSVFKRLGNVARGKLKEMGRNLSSDAPDDEPDELDPDRPPRRIPTPEAVGAPPKGESRRELLARMREEGLLTEEEYAEKLASLDAPPAERKPKKRRL